MTEQAERSTARLAWRHMAPMLRGEKLLVARLLLTGLGNAVGAMAIMLMIREFLSATLNEDRGVNAWLSSALGQEGALFASAGILLGAYFLVNYLYYDNQVTAERIRKVVELGILARVVRHIIDLSVPYVSQHSQGDLMEAIRTDIRGLREVILAAVGMFVQGLMCVSLAGAAFILSPYLFFWGFIVLPVAVVPIIALSRRIRARSYSIRRKSVGVFDFVLQVISGIRLVVTYGGNKNPYMAIEETAAPFYDENIRLQSNHALSKVLLEGLGGVSVVVIILIGGFQVMSGELNWPALLAFVMTIRGVFGPVNNVNAEFVRMQTYAAAVARVSELLETRPTLVDRDGARPLEQAPNLIRFEHVSFSYGEDLVIEDLNLEIRNGETLGIVGPSGSGKTTFLNLFARLYEPTSGRITYDGVDVRDYTLESVYGSYSIVTQHPYLFGLSVRDNILFGRPDASEEEVIEVAKAASVHEEILKLPQGYDTPIGITGQDLSGGQQQRVNIARALLKNAPILLLDEATSSLDSISEVKVQRAIDELSRNRTTIVVTHRLSTLRSADRVLVLRDGRFVACAPHQELLETCETYQELWKTQQLEGSFTHELEERNEALATP